MLKIMDDEDNPWRWIGTAIIGQPSQVIVQDYFGPYTVTSPVFLHDDGDWYFIDQPRRLRGKLVAWRYALESQVS